MKRLVCAIASALCFAPLLAQAADAVVIADITLQSGPDSEYPPISDLPAGTPVAVEGCIEGWTWCDVVAGGDRGWVPGTYLEENYGGQNVVIVDYGPRINIPIVTFSIGGYWDHYYRSRPFYTQRVEWEHRDIHPHAPPRAPAHSAVAAHVNGTPRPQNGQEHHDEKTVNQPRTANETHANQTHTTNEHAITAQHTPTPKPAEHTPPPEPHPQPVAKPATPPQTVAHAHSPTPAPHEAVTTKPQPKPTPKAEPKPEPKKESVKEKDDKKDGGGR